MTFVNFIFILVAEMHMACYGDLMHVCRLRVVVHVCDWLLELRNTV